MYQLEMFLTVSAAALLAGLLLLHRRLASSIEERADPPELERYPSVTVIRPIKGLDAGAWENLRAALEHGYSGAVETIFVFDDKDEPALPLAEEAIRAHQREVPDSRSQARIVFCGPPPPRRTGKLNAMIVALREARGELIVFADSDIRPDPQALTALVGTLRENAAAGSAFAPVVVTPAPETLGDAGYALLLNGMYGPAAELASQRAGYRLPFIMGQFMIFSREALDAIGGLESAEGQFVDDMYLGHRIEAAGYENVVSPHRVAIIQQGTSGKEFLGIYMRWLTFGRTGLPDWSFKLPPALQGLAFWAGLLFAATALIAGLWLSAAFAALGPLAVAASMVRLHERLGGAAASWRSYGGALLVMALAPVLFFSVYFKSEINWRGRSYKLDGGARLAAGGARPADELKEKRLGAH